MEVKLNVRVWFLVFFVFKGGNNTYFGLDFRFININVIVFWVFIALEVLIFFMS